MPLPEDHWMRRPTTLIALSLVLFTICASAGPYIMIYGALPCLLLLLAGVFGAWRALGGAQLPLNALALALVVLCGTTRVTMINQHKAHTYEATWTIKPHPSGDGEQLVTLSPEADPTHYDFEYSNELAAYLKASGKTKVPITYSVTYDFFKVRGYHIDAIDGKPTCPMTCTPGSIKTGSGGGGSQHVEGHEPPKKSIFAYFR